MKDNISFYLTFFFNSKNKLITFVEAKWNDEYINLSKSSSLWLQGLWPSGVSMGKVGNDDWLPISSVEIQRYDQQK